MSPRLALSTAQLICDMICSDASLSASQIAEAADCSNTLKHIHLNFQLYGIAKISYKMNSMNSLLYVVGSMTYPL